MIAQWSQGADVVYAVRKQREGETAFKLATASWFYKLFDKLAQVDLEPNSGDFRLLDRRALNALLAMTERSRFLRGMTVWVGFTQSSSPTSATLVTPARRSTRCARCCASRSTRSRRSRTCRCSRPHTWACSPRASRSSRSRSSSACTSLAPTCRLRLDHDRDPAARRHPADRARRDRRVRRTHLRRGQAPAAVHRPRGAQPPQRQWRIVGCPQRRRPARAGRAPPGAPSAFL